ncbi:MAG: hypothetical protein AB2448_07295 [Moorella sp. (in: firmicutes)]
MQLLNQFLRCGEGEGQPSSLLVEMTGLQSAETITACLWPLCLIAMYLAAGRKWRDMEILPRREDAEIEQYMNNTRHELWSVWQRVQVLPFYAGLSRGNAFGWCARVGNTLEAATAELVLAFIHGVKRPFRVCGKHMAFYHTECPRCRPESEARRRFFGLLRQHKRRLMAGEFRLEAQIKEYVASEIEAIQGEAREGRALRPLVERYRELCRENGLPTAWSRNYQSLLGKG